MKKLLTLAVLVAGVAFFAGCMKQAETTEEVVPTPVVEEVAAPVVEEVAPAVEEVMPEAVTPEAAPAPTAE